MHDTVAMLEDTVTTVRRVRRNAHTLKIFRRPSLDDLLPRPDLATADTVRAIAPCRQAARPTMIIRRPSLRRRSTVGWWAAGVALALASLVVVATMRDREAAITRVTAPLAANPIAIVDEPAATDVAPTTPPIVDGPGPITVEIAPETPSMALALPPEMKPLKSLKRAKRVKNRAARWNPDSLFLPK